MAARLAMLPEVGQTITLSRFIPGDQNAKLDLIRGTAATLDSALNPQNVVPGAINQNNRNEFSGITNDLAKIAGDDQGPGAIAAKRLSRLLLQLEASDRETRSAAETTVALPLRIGLDGLRKALHPEPVTMQTLPRDLVEDWLTPDGRARVQVLPKGDPTDPELIRKFATA